MKTNSSLLLLLSALTLNFNCMANDSKGATGADEITRPQRAAVKVVQTAGRTALGDFAPEFAHLNDDILFGEVWSRNDLLSLRDRSMITMTALIAQGITDSSLLHHLQNAKANGISRTEAAEIITHVAFYAGWPKAWAAFRLAKDVWADDISRATMPRPSLHEA